MRKDLWNRGVSGRNDPLDVSSPETLHTKRLEERRYRLFAYTRILLVPLEHHVHVSVIPHVRNTGHLRLLRGLHNREDMRDHITGANDLDESSHTDPVVLNKLGVEASGEFDLGAPENHRLNLHPGLQKTMLTSRPNDAKNLGLGDLVGDDHLEREGVFGDSLSRGSCSTAPCSTLHPWWAPLRRSRHRSRTCSRSARQEGSRRGAHCLWWLLLGTAQPRRRDR